MPPKTKVTAEMIVDAGDRRQVYREACEKVQKEYPDYTLQAAMDMDFSEISESRKTDS